MLMLWINVSILSSRSSSSVTATINTVISPFSLSTPIFVASISYSLLSSSSPSSSSSSAYLLASDLFVFIRVKYFYLAKSTSHIKSIMVVNIVQNNGGDNIGNVIATALINSPISSASSFAGSDTNITRNATQLLFPLPVSIFLGILSTIVSLSTVAGNLLVITAFIVERALRNPTNYFIISLAVTDLLIGIFSMNFYTLYLLMDYWPLGELFCDLWLSLDYTACLTSQYTVFFITVDRFCSVHIPAKYRNWRTDNKVLFMVAATWVIPSGIFFTCILGWPFFTGKRGCPPEKCYAGFTESMWFTTTLTIGYFWITLAVMSGLYSGIYQVAWNLQKKSDAKRRKMISLMSMAGQTMSRIGVGVNDNNPNENDVDHCNKKSSNLNASENSKLKAKKAQQKQEKLQKKKDIRAEDRNSSPTFPSDSDIVSDDVQTKMDVKQSNSVKITAPPIQYQIESPIIKDESPTLVETSPFTFFPFINTCGVTGTTTSVRFNNYRKAKTKLDPNNRNSIAPITFSTAYSNDSDYHTASGFSNEGQVNDGQNGLSPDYLQGYQYIDISSWKSSPNKFNLTLPIQNDTPKEQKNNKSAQHHYKINNKNYSTSDKMYFRQKGHICDYDEEDEDEDDDDEVALDSDDSPVWIRRNCCDNNCHSSSEADSHERDPITMDTFVVTKNYKMELSNNSLNDNDSNDLDNIRKFPYLTRISCASNIDFRDRLTSLRQRINLNSILSGIRNTSQALYYQIHRRIYHKANKEPKEKIGRGRTENRARKALKTITFILGAFVFCWTPYHILVLIQVHHPKVLNQHLFNLSYWLCYANSPINPFCYALANIQFKKTFLRLFRLDFHRT